MKKLKNVISLFDGMSCAQIALNQSGIEYENYFASEICKYGQIVSKANFPNTKYIGDVRFVSYKNGIITTQFGTFNIGRVDLLCGGSPCQSFSFAGKRKGMAAKQPTIKQLSDLAELKASGNQVDEGVFLATEHIEILTLDRYLQLKAEEYEFDGQSYLFWEYMRILTEIQSENPDVKFLLENVIMGEKWQTILTRAIGIQPIEINAALVSAQNRRRLFWTNIGAEPDGLFGDIVCKIPQPKDKGILLKDILEQEVDEKYFLSEKMTNYIQKESEKSVNRLRLTYPEQKKCGSALSNEYKQGTDSNFIVHNMQPRCGDPAKGGTGHLTRSDGKTYCLDTGNTNAVEIVGWDFRHDEGFRFRKGNKAGTRSTQGSGLSGSALAKIGSRIRRLTPIECERLQCVPDNFTNHVSDSQRYKMLGNGWNVDVIVHIFSYL